MLRSLRPWPRPCGTDDRVRGRAPYLRPRWPGCSRVHGRQSQASPPWSHGPPRVQPLLTRPPSACLRPSRARKEMASRLGVCALHTVQRVPVPEAEAAPHEQGSCSLRAPTRVTSRIPGDSVLSMTASRTDSKTTCDSVSGLWSSAFITAAAIRLPLVVTHRRPGHQDLQDLSSPAMGRPNR